MKYVIKEKNRLKFLNFPEADCHMISKILPENIFDDLDSAIEVLSTKFNKHNHKSKYTLVVLRGDCEDSYSLGYDDIDMMIAEHKLELSILEGYRDSLINK
jgi:hypothetical protein